LGQCPCRHYQAKIGSQENTDDARTPIPCHFSALLVVGFILGVSDEIEAFHAALLSEHRHGTTTSLIIPWSR
jgi:hypothetical protein